MPILQRIREGEIMLEMAVPALATADARDLSMEAPMVSPRDGLERVRERLDALQDEVRTMASPFHLLVDAVMLAAVAMQFAATFGSPGGRMEPDDAVSRNGGRR